MRSLDIGRQLTMLAEIENKVQLPRSIATRHLDQAAGFQLGVADI